MPLDRFPWNPARPCSQAQGESVLCSRGPGWQRVLGAAGTPVGDKLPEQQKYGSGLSASSWIPRTSLSLPFSHVDSSLAGGFKEPRRAGWALGNIPEPCGQALSAPLSLCSVLDDEGSNLRQQKLDRQVSETGPGGRIACPHHPDQSPGWGLRGAECGLPPSWGGPDWWGAALPEAALSFTLPARAQTSTWGYGQQAAGGLQLEAGCPCCGPARTAPWAEFCLLLLDSASWDTRDMRPWP